MQNFLGIGMMIMDLNIYPGIFERADDIDHARISNVGHVFLKGQAKHRHSRVLGRSFAQQRPNDLICDNLAHAVINPTTGQNHLRVITKFL